jgi:hypothetical protein
VRIEFDAPAAAFVSFPCWAWNTVYAGDLLALSGSEDRAWRRRLRAAGLSAEDETLPLPFRAELESSWRRLFRPDLPDRSWRRSDPFRGREAVLPVLKLDWVRRVTPFVGTHRAYARAIAGRRVRPRP